MQTEATALLILLLAIIFSLKEKKIYNILTAFTISMLFFLKGITLLYSVIVLIVMILNKKSTKQIIQIIVTSFLFLISELFIFYIIDPSFITDIYLSTQYITENWESYSLPIYILYSMINLIYFGIGLICLCFNIIIHIKTKNKKLLLLEAMSWIILFFGVYIQKLRYLYQIALMMPACLFSIMISIYYYKNKMLKLNIYIKMILATYIIMVAILGFTKELENTIKMYKVTYKNEQIVEQIYKKNPDLADEEVLYIGNGLSAYYIKAKSYTKYTTTIYLSNENQTYLDSKYVKQLKEKIKNYTGKYIIIDDEEWNKKRRLSDDIIEFIEQNYHYKQTTGITIYEFDKEEYSSIYVKNE